MIINWQPIETAPTDGTPVLICGGIYESDARVWGEEYPLNRPVVATFQPDEGEWLRDGYGVTYNEQFWHRPTHWMPLPPFVPTAEPEEGEVGEAERHGWERLVRQIQADAIVGRGGRDTTHAWVDRILARLRRTPEESGREEDPVPDIMLTQEEFERFRDMDRLDESGVWVPLYRLADPYRPEN